MAGSECEGQKVRSIRFQVVFEGPAPFHPLFMATLPDKREKNPVHEQIQPCTFPPCHYIDSFFTFVCPPVSPLPVRHYSLGIFVVSVTFSGLQVMGSGVESTSNQAAESELSYQINNNNGNLCTLRFMQCKSRLRPKPLGEKAATALWKKLCH